MGIWGAPYELGQDFGAMKSTPGAQLLCADIKYYFPNNPMSRYEYMKTPLSWFPHDIIDQYKIMHLVKKYGFVFVKICKGM